VKCVANSAGAAEIRQQALLRPGERAKRQAALQALRRPARAYAPPSAETLAKSKEADDDLKEIGGDSKHEDLALGTKVRVEGYTLPSPSVNNQLQLNIKGCRLIKMDWMSYSDPIVALFSQDGQDLLMNQTEWILDNHDPVFKTPLSLALYSENAPTNFRLRLYDVDTEVVTVDDMMGYVNITLAELQEACFTNTPLELILKSDNRRRQRRLNKRSSSVVVSASFVG